MTAVALVVASFVVMEGISYAAHRWVMHGPGLTWHRSHHSPPSGGWERNDRFPACFSVVAIALFALAAAGWTPGWWIALGVTLYGAAYLFVHEVFIHHRLPFEAGSVRYLEWLRAAHADHHLASGEPYGMLLPLRRDRRSSPRSPADVLDRSTRTARGRL
jgi:beta-carotene 3-hydroxylase